MSVPKEKRPGLHNTYRKTIFIVLMIITLSLIAALVPIVILIIKTSSESNLSHENNKNSQDYKPSPSIQTSRRRDKHDKSSSTNPSKATPEATKHSLSNLTPTKVFPFPQPNTHVLDEIDDPKLSPSQASLLLDEIPTSKTNEHLTSSLSTSNHTSYQSPSIDQEHLDSDLTDCYPSSESEDDFESTWNRSSNLPPGKCKFPIFSSYNYKLRHSDTSTDPIVEDETNLDTLDLEQEYDSDPDHYNYDSDNDDNMLCYNCDTGEFEGSKLDYSNSEKECLNFIPYKLDNAVTGNDEKACGECKETKLLGNKYSVNGTDLNKPSTVSKINEETSQRIEHSMGNGEGSEIKTKKSSERIKGRRMKKDGKKSLNINSIIEDE